MSIIYFSDRKFMTVEQRYNKWNTVRSSLANNIHRMHRMPLAPCDNPDLLCWINRHNDDIHILGYCPYFPLFPIFPVTLPISHYSPYFPLLSKIPFTPHIYRYSHMFCYSPYFLLLPIFTVNLHISRYSPFKNQAEWWYKLQFPDVCINKHY